MQRLLSENNSGHGSQSLFFKGRVVSIVKVVGIGLCILCEVQLETKRQQEATSDII